MTASRLTPGQLLQLLETAAGGPHDPEATVAAAWLAAETIRYLNYAADTDEGIQFASTLYSAAGALSLAAGRTPQLIGQMSAWLNAHADLLVNDDGALIGDTLAAVGASGQAAAGAAALLAHHLSELQSALARTGNRGIPAGKDCD